MQLRITIAMCMVEIRNRKTLHAKVNICKSDVKIRDYADSLVIREQRSLVIRQKRPLVIRQQRPHLIRQQRPLVIRQRRPLVIRQQRTMVISLRSQPIAASSRSTIWSGGNCLRWVPPS